MMRKAIFLDRDGTINVEKNYLYKIEEFEYLPGVKEGLKILQKLGFILIIVTNQSGIARGYYTVQDYFKLTEWMIADLKKDGINIANCYYCPHHPESKIEQFKKDCNCRKPRLGLFEKAIMEYDIDLSNSYAIGDKYRDLALCDAKEQNTVQGFLLYTKNKEKGNIHCIEGGVYEAAKCIEKREENGKMD